MRTIQTILLRLLIDTDHPEAIRGTLQAVDKGKEPVPFRDESMLLALLKNLNAEPFSSKPTAKLEDDKK